MKFLHITDTHATAKNPSSREDVYYVSILRKFIELGDVIRKNGIEAVIHTGDLFHTPRVSLKIAGQLAEIFKSWDVPVYVVPGNHDIDGYTISTIDQTMLGMLSSTGVIELITRDNPIEYDINGSTLRIEGQEYYADIDKGIYDDYRMEQPADYSILAIHSMLMEKPYFPEVPHTLIQDVNTRADLILTGHYHPGFTEIQLNGTWFFNPGSLLRVEIDSREPKFLIFEIDENELGDLDLVHYEYGSLRSASPSTVIFDMASHQQVKAKKQGLSNFKQAVQQAVGMNHHLTVSQLLQKIASEQSIDTTVVQTAEHYLAQAKTSEEQLNQELKGYLEKPNNVYLAGAELTNFQSHESTSVTFDKDMTVIIGETNSGKSALLRGIIWCLYNEPRGTDFIMTGKSSCSVKLTFSDGSSIERMRSRSSAGKYIVTDDQGVTQTFAGFANDIPGEVANQHQMPLVQLTKDIKCSLNVASQLEGPFLLSESNLQKANAIGRIVGTQTVDAAIKELNKASLSSSRQMKQYQTEIEGFEKQLLQYQDLEKRRQEYELFEMTLSSYEVLKDQTNDLAALTNQYYLNLMMKDNQIENLSKLPDLKGVDSYILDIEQFGRELSVLHTLHGQATTACERLQDATYRLKQIPVVNHEDPMFKETNELIEDIRHLITIRDHTMQSAMNLHSKTVALENIPVVQEVKTDSAEALIHEILRLHEAKETLSSDDAILKTLKTKLSQVSSQEDVIAKQQQQLQDEINEKLKDHECPTCGTLLGEQQIQHILRGDLSVNS